VALVQQSSRELLHEEGIARGTGEDQIPELRYHLSLFDPQRPRITKDGLFLSEAEIIPHMQKLVEDATELF
jgi:hypothetical protein